MPLFTSKKQHKNQTTFSPAKKEMTTQKQTYLSESMLSNKKKKPVKIAKFKDYKELLVYFFTRVDETVEQLNILYKSVKNIDDSIDADSEVLNDKNTSEALRITIRENRAILQEVRKGHLKAMNIMTKDLIKEENEYIKKRLELEKAGLKKKGVSEKDWQAYSEQLQLESKMMIVNKLQNSEFSHLISIPAELNLKVLEVKRDNLTETEKAEKAKAKATIALNNKFSEIQGKITNNANHKNLLKIYRTNKITDLFKYCLKLKEEYWDKNRDQFLDSKYLIDNIENYLPGLLAAEKFMAEYNKDNKDILIKSRAKSIFTAIIEKENLQNLVEKAGDKKGKSNLTEEEKLTLTKHWNKASGDATKEVESVKDIISYMQLHVNNMMADCGKEIFFIDNYPRYNELEENKSDFAARQKAWNDDYVQYKKLVEKQPEAEGKKDNARNATINDDTKLAALEKELGVDANHDLELNNLEENRRQIVGTLDEKDANQTGTFRLNQYYMANYNNSRYDVIKISRINNIVDVLIGKLKNEHVDTENFEKIKTLFSDYIQKMYSEKFVQDDYITYTDALWKSIKNRLFYTIKYSNNYREKHYAAHLSTALIALGAGELNYTGKADYIVTDSDFRDITSRPEFRDKKTGEKMKRGFMSVANQSLFEHEPSLKDINQGEVGDCYLLASIASIVSSHPEKIKKMMRDNMDGTVTVRFFDTDERTMPIYVTVAKTIPVDRRVSGKVEDVYAKGPLWIKMIEKAYACVRLKHGMQRDNGYNLHVTNRLRAKDDRFECKYENLTAGNEFDALRHLTGEKTDYKADVYEETKIKIFESRMMPIDATKLRPNVDVLSYLLFKDKNGGDFKAIEYLANYKAKNKVYEQELSHYHHLSELLERTLIITYGQDTVRTMNSDAFVNGLKAIINSLATFKDISDHTPSNADLKKAGLPAKAIKYFKKCWKDYLKKGNAFFNDISRMVELFNTDYRLVLQERKSDYTKAEDDIFDTIKEKLKNKKAISFGTMNFKSNNKKINGKMGEKFKDGMYAIHVYAVVGAEKIELNGVKKKWLITQNPHGDGIPVYKLNDDGTIRRIARTDSEDYENDFYDDQTHGLFLLELRDACSIINEISFTQ